MLATNLVDTSYIAIDLTFGTTYEFKLESRNEYGYSDFSATLTLLCAFIPDPPLSISTSNDLDQVLIAWNDPIDNGSPITGYQVFVR